jgi:hypothetical protein
MREENWMAKPSPQDQAQVYLDDPAFGPIDNIGMLLTAKHVRVAAKHTVGIVRVEAFWKGSLNWALHNTVLIC